MPGFPAPRTRSRHCRCRVGARRRATAIAAWVSLVTSGMLLTFGTLLVGGCGDNDGCTGSGACGTGLFDSVTYRRLVRERNVAAYERLRAALAGASIEERVALFEPLLQELALELQRHCRWPESSAPAADLLVAAGAPARVLLKAYEPCAQELLELGSPRIATCIASDSSWGHLGVSQEGELVEIVLSGKESLVLRVCAAGALAAIGRVPGDSALRRVATLDSEFCGVDVIDGDDEIVGWHLEATLDSWLAVDEQRLVATLEGGTACWRIQLLRAAWRAQRRGRPEQWVQRCMSDGSSLVRATAATVWATRGGDLAAARHVVMAEVMSERASVRKLVVRELRRWPPDDVVWIVQRLGDVERGDPDPDVRSEAGETIAWAQAQARIHDKR